MSQQPSETFNLFNDASFAEAFHERAVSNAHIETTARQFAYRLTDPRILDVRGLDGISTDYSNGVIN